MSHHEQILKRIAWLRAELDALAHLIEVSALDTPAGASPAQAPAVAAPAEAVVEAAAAPVAASKPAPAPKAAAKAKKVRWSYQPGTWYHIVGENPFRNGNNYNLFAYLQGRYGTAPFSREQLSQAIGTLSSKGRVNSRQEEDTFVMIFLRGAGALKNRIEMCDAPAGGASKPVASVKDALPPEPGEVAWKLSGSPRFRAGSINATLWAEIGDRTISRDDLTVLASALKDAGSIDSARPADIIARDFLGVVVDKGLASKA